VQSSGTTIVDTVLPAPQAPTTTSPRLAELVIHLTDCDPALAVAAVDAATGGVALGADDDRLAAVAQAIISVRRTIDLRDPKPTA
jgi:hypothetical protein